MESSMSYFPAASSPVRPVDFGKALKISLDSYYDLLKAQTGGLQAGEFLQLKLVADPVAISDKEYKWYSYYQLLRRSDRAIAPTPIDGVVLTSGSDLASEYEKFLRKLRTYVVKVNLKPDEQQKIAELDGLLERAKNKINDFAKLDRTNWKQFAEMMGYQYGDEVAFQQWAVHNGHRRDIEALVLSIQDWEFDKRTILDRKYPEPSDREIVQAEFDFTNPYMRLRYPLHPDRDYPNGASFNVTYLSGLPLGSSGQFDDRRVVTWDKPLDFIMENGAGGFTAKLDRTTSSSSSITTDWSGSASGSYGLFISVRASASEHRQIQEDFSNGTSLELSAKSAFKTEIVYPKWFQPILFQNKRVVDNLIEFESFFGKKGSLLYYPSHLVLVRGFSIKFTSTQSWTFDYKKRYSASGGGGFNAFGFGFGGGGSYEEDMREHNVDVANTHLTIGDDEKTVRFVGYVLRKVTVFDDHRRSLIDSAIGKGLDKLK